MYRGRVPGRIRYITVYFIRLGSSRGPPVTTTISTEVIYENPNILERLPFRCPFDVEDEASMCDFVQDASDDFDWSQTKDGTPTENTGPPESSYTEHGIGLSQ